MTHPQVNSLNNYRILLGVSGGIAAYKAANLCRLLVKAGAEVRVVMTAAATEFVTPLTFQALSSNRVHLHSFDLEAEAAMGHIELARWADLILIAPASANTLAKLSHGIADNLLTTLCLASPATLAVAPAMNQQMWANLATQSNVQGLRQQGIHIWGPNSGEQACGDIGTGRMQEPEELLDATCALFHNSIYNGSLAGKRLVITAGPTHEAIDPVRYIGNRSSGKMGYAIARAARRAGAQVTLISGPTQLATPEGCQRINIESASEMFDAAMQTLNDDNGPYDCFIGVAAVADYRCQDIAEQKIKKQAKVLNLSLIRNPDILASIAKHANRPVLCVGFAAETERLENHAQQKLIDKNLDIILANRVTDGAVFGADDNELLWISSSTTQTFGPAPKAQLADTLIAKIAIELASLVSQKTPS